MDEELGVYVNFPDKCHYAVRFEIKAPTRDVQEALLNTLHRLNGRKVIGDLVIFIGSNVNVILEFGVANGLIFDYLNEDTFKILLKAVGKRDLRILDFFCVVRYYVLRGKSRRALRFDYYLLRFLFHDGGIEAQVFHERGMQRISAEDLLSLIMDNVFKHLGH